MFLVEFDQLINGFYCCFTLKCLNLSWKTGQLLKINDFN